MKKECPNHSLRTVSLHLCSEDCPIKKDLLYQHRKREYCPKHRLEIIEGKCKWCEEFKNIIP